MIVWRTMATAKRGHMAEVVSWLKQWNAKHRADSRVKGIRLFSSYIGDNDDVVTNELKFENMADWESFYNEMAEGVDFSNWYEMTTRFDHDFWVVEEES